MALIFLIAYELTVFVNSLEPVFVTSVMVSYHTTGHLTLLEHANKCCLVVRELENTLSLALILSIDRPGVVRSIAIDHLLVLQAWLFFLFLGSSSPSFFFNTSSFLSSSYIADNTIYIRLQRLLYILASC